MQNSSSIPSSATLDIVRVLAMTGVVADHYMQAKGGELWDNIGLWLGAVCVSIFFSISAFLFGRKWRDNAYKPFNPATYFRKRFIRIFIPLWIAITLIIIIQIYLEKSFESSTVIFNLVGLGWLFPLQFGGHLWYISMLLTLYFLFFVLSYLRTNILSSKHMYLASCILILLTLIYGLFPEKLSTISLTLPPIISLIGLLLFYNGTEIIAYASKYKILTYSLTSLFFVASLFAYTSEWSFTFKAMTTLMSTIAGFMLFILVISEFSCNKHNPFIKNLSSLSYEIYLVHAPLLPLVGHFIKSIWLLLPIWLLATYTISFIIKFTTHIIITSFTKKNEYA